MVRNLGLAVVLMFTLSHVAYAQEDKPCAHQKKDKKEEKQKPTEAKKPSSLVTIDLPLLPYRVVIDEKRVAELNVNLGTVKTPWEKTMKFKYAVAPRITMSTKSFRTTLDFGFMESRSSAASRKTRQFELASEGSLFFVTGGVDGFVFYEDVANAIKGLHQTSDFSRRGFGVRGRIGFKVGSFNRNFFTVGGYPWGRLWSEGSNSYDIPELSLPPEDLPLYNEEFDVQSVFVEGKYGFGYLAFGSEAEANWYRRRLHSPDSDRFGRNMFNDVTARSFIEIIPFGPKHDIIRVVVENFMVYGHKERLMFKYDPPKTQLMIRIAF